jgi:phosphatidylinositol alpha-1,6-mannosyltransferase
VFTGGVDWDDVPAYVDAGDVFAMPCRTRLGGLEPEAWGIVSLEAQACGLPVVLGDAGGAPETLSSLEAGQVLRRTDDVAQVLTTWLSRRARDRSRGAAAPEWTWEGAARRLDELWISR